jgi:hypothetical protein
MMREWIDTVTAANEEILDEEVLNERSMRGVEINKNGITKLIDVLENPVRSQLKRAYTDQNKGWFRGFLTPDDTVYVFDAYNATHYDVGTATGLTGTRFEIRGTDAEPMSMLYLPNGVPGKPWRDKPMIARMFDQPNFHIGSLR